MKKPAVGVLVLVTGIFAAFTAGFFAGRHLNRAPVRIYQTPALTESTIPEIALTAPIPTGPVVININTATARELEALPGIGPALAQRIVDYRAANGPFRTTEELIKVKGIGESKMKDLLDHITVGG